MNKEKKTVLAAALVLLVYLITVFLNYGFIASDEYWDAINRYIPAQKADVFHLVTSEDVKSPLQILPMHMVAQLALKSGLTSPFNQYQAVIIFFGIFGIIFSLAALFWLRRKGDYLTSDRSLSVAILLFGFHCAMPGVITRPMFETLAVPWMTILAVAALIYDHRQRLRQRATMELIIGVVAGSLSFMLRQQTGVCALVMVLLPLWHRQWKDFFLVSVLGCLFFILSGVPDFFLRGEFHYSLKNLILYNITHGAEYISQPWYFFFPIIFIFMFGPWLLMAYPRDVLERVKRGRALYWILGLFLIEHMLFANKWERFLFSMFPVMILMMEPFIESIFENRKNYAWRWISLLLFNFTGWILATFSPAQKNIIDLALYLNKSPRIKVVYNLEEALSWIPDVFIEGAVPELRPYRLDEGRKIWDTLSCDSILVVKKSTYLKNPDFFSHQVIVHEFSVNLIDGLAYQLNKEHNERRSPLLIFGCSN